MKVWIDKRWAEVENVDGEPFRFRVKSRRTDEWYLCDIQTRNWFGECNCPNFHFEAGPEQAKGKTVQRCFHLRAAREASLEVLLPKVAWALKMEEDRRR